MMAVVGVVCRSRYLLRKDCITGFRYSTLLISVPNDNCVNTRHSFGNFREISVCATNHDHGKTISEVYKADGIIGGRNISTSSSSSSSSSDSDTTDLDEDGLRRARVSRLQPLGQNNIYYQHSEVTIEYVRGLPHITVPLPSRKERCRFTVRPLSNTVGDLLAMMRHEDGGIDRAVACALDGTRIASSNTVESLLDTEFRLVINENTYTVKPPKCERISGEEVQRLNDVRNIVSQLYEALNVQEHQVQKERDLSTQLETLRQELLPLEEKRIEVELVAQRKTDYMAWVGLGLMSVQFGILARLTWWEYSWDIMEPVTYFVTYGTAMAAYAYYVITKQEYILNDVRDRQHLLAIHKKAKKLGIDLVKYNQLKDQIRSLELDLRKIKDPLRLHNPTQLATAAPTVTEQKPISWAPSIDDATGGTGNTTDLKATTDAKTTK